MSRSRPVAVHPEKPKARKRGPRSISDNRSLLPTHPKGWLVAVLLAASLGIVYLRSLDAPFFFDDDVSIVKNTSIVSLWPLIGTAQEPGPLNPVRELPTAGRPIVNFSFAVTIISAA